MREYKQRGFTKAQIKRETKKLTAILKALRDAHRSLGTVNGGEEKTLALHAMVFAYQQVNTLRQFKGIAEARGLRNETVLNAELEDAIDVSLSKPEA